MDGEEQKINLKDLYERKNMKKKKKTPIFAMVNYTLEEIQI